MVTSYLLFCLPSLNQSKMYTFVSFVSLCIYLNEPKRRKGKKPPVPEGNSGLKTDSLIYFTENTRTQSCHINARIGVTLKERWPPRTTTSDLRPSQSPSYWSHTPALNQEHCINTHTNQQFSAKYPLSVFLPDVTQLYIPCVVILFFFPDLVSVFSVVFFFILVLSLI